MTYHGGRPHIHYQWAAMAIVVNVQDIHGYWVETRYLYVPTSTARH